MKRYLVFIVSFAILHITMQVLLGWYYTSKYVPDLVGDFNNVGSKVEFGMFSYFPVLLTLLSATIAYFLSMHGLVSPKSSDYSKRF